MNMSLPPSKTDQRALAALVHLLGLFTSVCGPLIAWGLSRSHRNDYLTQQSIESVNFQLTVIVFYLVCKILSIIFIGFVLLPFVFAFQIIFPVIAAILVSRGVIYRYPYTLPLLRS